MALYNKYRPVRLDDLVGQDVVKKVLRNQIARAAKDQVLVAHSYLFVGGAGTGKTTTARILAAMVNASGGITENPDPNDENVQMIFSGRSALDVVEMDAASNSGIDNAREIVKNADFRPVNMPYKVWIIDECHKLSKDAWQALLKLLEEPPEYVIVVLCTTESDTIPETIQTRCVCLRFRSLRIQDIVAQLRKIADAEKIKVPDEVLRSVATWAKGSMRMAIKALEQANDYCQGKEITQDNVASCLGIATRDHAKQFLSSVISYNFLKGLQATSNAVADGVNPEDFMAAVAQFCHDLMICKNEGFDMESYGYTKEETERLRTNYDQLQRKLVDLGSKVDAKHILRKWVEVVDRICKLKVFHVQPQSFLDVLWVEMVETLRATIG